MAKEAKPTDVFMQFAAISLLWPGVSTTLTEASLKTGLSIRGGLMWLIHMIEIVGSPPGGGGKTVEYALSVRDSLVSMPRLDDPGCLAYVRKYILMTTSGMALNRDPMVVHFLPPVPLAAPNLSFYCVAGDDQPALDGTSAIARIGYTTTPLDAKSYAEIAETWAYV